MKCEGEKIYNEPGRCPVCGMFLAPIEEVNTSVKEEKCHAVLQQAIYIAADKICIYAHEMKVRKYTTNPEDVRYVGCSSLLLKKLISLQKKKKCHAALQQIISINII
jgi:hypothetical protein